MATQTRIVVNIQLFLQRGDLANPFMTRAAIFLMMTIHALELVKFNMLPMMKGYQFPCLKFGFENLFFRNMDFRMSYSNNICFVHQGSFLIPAVFDLPGMTGFANLFAFPLLVTIQALTMIGSIQGRFGEIVFFDFYRMTFAAGGNPVIRTKMMTNRTTLVHGCHVRMKSVLKNDGFENVLQLVQDNNLRGFLKRHDLSCKWYSRQNQTDTDTH